eukprot:2275962-Karenia_brevis.AAC.1
MDISFWGGLPPDSASRLLAGIKFFVPWFSKDGHGTLPRAHRVVRIWQKVSPQKQRAPFPLLALCAVLGWLMARGQYAISMNLFFQFFTYLRPGVNDRLKVKQLVPPTPQAGQGYQHWILLLSPIEDTTPGKTGMFDETIVLDSHA